MSGASKTLGEPRLQDAGRLPRPRQEWSSLDTDERDEPREYPNAELSLSRGKLPKSVVNITGHFGQDR